MHENSRFGRSLTAYARLVRLPNLFTAPPDIVLGAAIVASAGYSVSVDGIVGLAFASVLLYAAGTTLNDYFDATEDARERPERPIPTGEVTQRRAVAFGAVLLGSGVLIALIAAGLTAGIVAATLVLAILLYDGGFKGSSVGFLLMGGSRGLNVLLGTTVAASPTSLPSWGFGIPALISLYIAGVTFLGESETGNSNSLAVVVAIAVTGVAALGVVVLLIVRTPPLMERTLSIILLVGFTGWTGRALSRAYVAPSPATIGPTVGTCVLALTILNAALAATVGVRWSLTALLFLVPAAGFSRVFDVS